MAEMARQIKASPAGMNTHRSHVTADPDSRKAVQPSLLSANAIVALQRYVGNSGVQRLLDHSLQRKKYIDEDVQITGNLSVSNDVFSEKDLMARGKVSTGGNVNAKGLWTSGEAAVDGDLVVRVNTRKG